MENLYHWHNEEMVRLEMEDFKKEIDSIRLINDAGLSNPNLFARLAIAVGKIFVNIGNHLHKNYTEPDQAYQVTSCKYAA